MDAFETNVRKKLIELGGRLHTIINEAQGGCKDYSCLLS